MPLTMRGTLHAWICLHVPLSFRLSVSLGLSLSLCLSVSLCPNASLSRFSVSLNGSWPTHPGHNRTEGTASPGDDRLRERGCQVKSRVPSETCHPDEQLTIFLYTCGPNMAEDILI